MLWTNRPIIYHVGPCGQELKPLLGSKDGCSSSPLHRCMWKVVLITEDTSTRSELHFRLRAPGKRNGLTISSRGDHIKILRENRQALQEVGATWQPSQVARGETFCRCFNARGRQLSNFPAKENPRETQNPAQQGRAYNL